MKTLITTLLILFCFQTILIAQCECTDCPIFVPSNTTQTSNLSISGASNGTLGSGGQSLCMICIDLFTDAIQELDMNLIAPDGSSVQLMINQGINVNANMTFTICFTQCNQPAAPDPGHQAVFMTNDGWTANTSYNGTYYPAAGCLENLTGSVDGVWSLEITDVFSFDDSTLNGWYLVFTDDTGIGCANAGSCTIIPPPSCDAEAGSLISTNSPTCPGGSISISVAGENSNAGYDQYILIVDQTNTVIDLVQAVNHSYSSLVCGDFDVYSYNLQSNSSALAPSIGDNIGSYNCTSSCCELEFITISFEDDQEPFFTFVPENPNFPGGTFQPIFCVDDIPPGMPASYDDNCIGAGSVDAVDMDFSDPCTGGTYSRRWTIKDSCTINPVVEEQVMIIEPRPEAMYQNPPEDIVVPCDQVPISAPNLDYTNGISGTCAIVGSSMANLFKDYNGCGGTATFTWVAVDECNRSIEYTQFITVQESDPPEFVNPPDDIIIGCEDIPEDPMMLLISNGATGDCLIEQQVVPTIVNNFNGCEGEIELVWNYIDPCGRPFLHTQILTVLSPDQATFINPPADIAIGCDELDQIERFLSYSNGFAGDCAIDGSVEAIQSGSFDACGGEVIFTWEFIDACDRMISHEQRITIGAAPAPTFLNIPQDRSLDCGDDQYFPPDLNYSNQAMGDCLIEGSISPVTTVVGNVITVSWEYDPGCNSAAIMAQQLVTIEDIPIPVITPDISSICLGESYDLAILNITDNNSTGATVSLHNNIPNGMNTLMTNSLVSPADTTTYYILLETATGCQAFATFVLNVDPPFEVANDGGGSFCNENQAINLFNYLSDVSDSLGVWEDLNQSGINLSDPSSVNFFGIDPAVYSYQYVVASDNSCPADTAFATIDLIGINDITIQSVSCSADMLFYNVIFSIMDMVNIDHNVGLINNLGNGDFAINDISVSDTLYIDISDGAGICTKNFEILPPDCTCPTVPAPITDGDQVICPHELPTLLTVNVPNQNYSVNWYSQATGGNLLLANSSVFSPLDVLPGIYIYYAETVDLINIGCTSNSRTPVMLTISEPPNAENSSLSACYDIDLNLATFDFNNAISSINNEPNTTITFHASLAEAEAAQNNLDLIFSLNQMQADVIYVRVEDDQGCFNSSMLALNVLAPPSVSLEFSDESCPEAADGMLIIQPDGTSQLQTSIVPDPFENTLVYSSLSSDAYTLEILDENQCLNRYPFNIDLAFEFILVDTEFNCSDNGTPTDPTDDFYSWSLFVDNTANNSTYELVENGQVLGVYNYGQNEIINIPADALIHNYIIQDPLSGCDYLLESPNLAACSTPCDNDFEIAVDFSAPLILDCDVSNIIATVPDDPNLIYEWSNGNLLFMGITVALIEGGTWTVLATDVNNGCTWQETFVVDSDFEPPNVAIETVDVSCLGENDGQLLIENLSGSGEPFIFSLNGDFISAAQLNNLVAAEYQLEIIGGNGCSIDTMITILSASDWNLSLPGAIRYERFTDNQIVAITDLAPDEIAEISWTPNENLSCNNCLDPLILSPSDSIYTLSIRDIYGCERSEEILVIFKADYELIIPNVFSPNNDSFNDRLIPGIPSDINLSELEMQIFDRWGQLVFAGTGLHQNQVENAWDGTARGRALNPAVFTYWYRAVIEGSGEVIFGAGDVTLVR